MKERLFIAIPLPENIRRNLYDLLKPSASYRITKKENLHITILFLGDTEVKIIPKINTVLENMLKKVKAFDLDISKLGQFPPQGNAKIIYASGDKNVRILNDAAGLIRGEFAGMGFIDNHEFRYHITLARAKNEFIKEKIFLSMNDTFTFKVNEAALYKSILKKDGPLYDKIFSVNLND